MNTAPPAFMTKEYRHFYLRRCHSLLGFALLLFVIQHLWANSQILEFLLWKQPTFIHYVNKLHQIPARIWIEVFLLTLPFLFHIGWGFSSLWYYLRHPNVIPNKMVYPRQRAFHWQRITAVALLVGIVIHVVDMRWVHSPKEVNGVYWLSLPTRWIDRIDGWGSIHSMEGSHALIAFPDIGTAFFFLLQSTFYHIPWALFYSLLVAMTSYHACNGLSTFCMTWGITTTARAQRKMALFCLALGLGLTCLGWIAIWSSYLLAVGEV